MDSAVVHADHLGGGPKSHVACRPAVTAQMMVADGVRILVVDDVPAVARVMAELLVRRGYRVAGESHSAADALAMIDRLTPDAVLLDVNLPDVSGFELAARIAQAHPSLAVLLTSADSHDGFYALAHDCGACGFVPKGQLAQADLAQFWPSPS